MKVCKTCGEEKNLSEFYKVSEKYYHSYCKPCYSVKVRERDVSSGRMQYKGMAKIMGLSYAELDKIYQAFFVAQDGKCAVCGVHQNRLDRNFCMDHDHETMKIRGLLCRTCNVGIGMLKDNICVLSKAIEYLQNNTPKKGKENEF